MNVNKQVAHTPLFAQSPAATKLLVEALTYKSLSRLRQVRPSLCVTPLCVLMYTCICACVYISTCVCMYTRDPSTYTRTHGL